MIFSSKKFSFTSFQKPIGYDSNFNINISLILFLIYLIFKKTVLERIITHFIQTIIAQTRVDQSIFCYQCIDGESTFGNFLGKFFDQRNIGFFVKRG
jgi:hypothetical protein